jgi:hypothetical protein
MRCEVVRAVVPPSTRDKNERTPMDNGRPRPSTQFDRCGPRTGPQSETKGAGP